MTNKEKLICDIQQLLNSYKGCSTTTINPDLLQYMDESDLKQIVDDLLKQKEQTIESNENWLKQFKNESL